MEFFDPYLKDVGSLLTWLSKIETSVTALQVVQGVAAILGIIFSTLGIYKAWRYAEKRLGKRLDEYLNAEEEKLVAARRLLQATRRQIAVNPAGQIALPSKRELKPILKPLGARYLEPPKQVLKDALALASERQALARKRSEFHFHQQALVHLLLGASASSEEDHENALKHFRAALSIDKHDTDAIEYLGFQLLKAGDGEQALEQFERLRAIAESRNDPLLVSRAHRNCGLAHLKCSPPSNFKANAALKRAIHCFPHSGSVFELAHIYELRAQVNMQQQRTLPLAGRCLERALTNYSALEYEGNGDASAARAGIKRIVEAQAVLRRASEPRPQASDDEDGRSDDEDGSIDSTPA